MKKNFKYFGIVWIVVFALFNAITFLIPNKIFGITRFDKPLFWVAYALITLSLVGQIIVAYLFLKEDSAEKTFLRIPLLGTAYTALGIAFIVGVVFMTFPVLPTWIGAIVCLVITAYFIVACIKAKGVADIVSEVDEKVKEKNVFMRLAVLEAETIHARATTAEIKTETKKVCEALRYSDPISNITLEEIEKEINGQLSVLKKCVLESDENGTQATAKELLLLIKERNSKCKILK